MTSARMIPIKQLLYKKYSIILIPVIIILLIPALLTLLTSKNASTAYIVNFKTESQALEFCKQFHDNKELITPYNFEVPISNFHEIEDDTLDHIRKRFIDNDIRNTVLLKKLIDFFYISKNKNQFSVKLLAKSQLADKLVTSKLQKEQISFSKIPVSTNDSNEWIVISLFIIAVIIMINIQSSYTRKILLILFGPWFAFMFFSLSVIFSFSVLILLLTALNIIVLYYEKISNNDKLPFPATVVLLIGIILSLSLVATSLELILYYVICVFYTYTLFILTNRIQRKKEHRIPFFVKILPDQPRWLLYNKLMVLTAGAAIIVFSTLFTNTHALISISKHDYEMHIQKQFLSIYGSIYNASSKPSVSISNETVHLIFLDPLQVTIDIKTSASSSDLEKKLASLSSSQPLLNKYSIILIGVMCVFILFDIFSSAGKKIKKLIYFKNSVKTLPDGINITITDASI